VGRTLPARPPDPRADPARALSPAFTFKAEGDTTLVTWSMAGKNNLVGKMFCLVVNMDKTIGGVFERGFAHLDAVASAATKNDRLRPSRQVALPMGGVQCKPPHPALRAPLSRGDSSQR
jgi:hypothetical protein